MDRVREAADAYKRAEAERQAAREELAQALREAVEEGIPLMVAARAAGISRQAARLLLRKEKGVP